MKDNKIVWVIIIALLLVGVYYYYTTTTSDNAAPVGDGWDLKLFDSSGNELILPKNFMVSQPTSSGSFAIWTTEVPIACTSDAQCPGGGATSVKCFNSICSVRNVATMSLGFGVTSTSSSVSYTNLNVATATPAAWLTALNKTARTLAPMATTPFTSTTFAIPATWIGTNQVFSVTVTGTNSYSGAVETQTKTITYKFMADPTGGFTVTIANPFA